MPAVALAAAAAAHVEKMEAILINTQTKYYFEMNCPKNLPFILFVLLVVADANLEHIVVVVVVGGGGGGGGGDESTAALAWLS